jgi:hypothetical protein
VITFAIATDKGEFSVKGYRVKAAPGLLIDRRKGTSWFITHGETGRRITSLAFDTRSDAEGFCGELNSVDWTAEVYDLTKEEQQAYRDAVSAAREDYLLAKFEE